MKRHRYQFTLEAGQVATIAVDQLGLEFGRALRFRMTSPQLCSGEIATVFDPATGMGTIGATTNTNVPSKFRPAVVGRVGSSPAVVVGIGDTMFGGAHQRNPFERTWGRTLASAGPAR